MSVENIFSAVHSLSRELLSKVQPADVEELQQIALGEIPHRSVKDRVKALNAITCIGIPQCTEILSNILQNDEEDKYLRVTAASLFSLVPSEDAESELIACLGTEEALVRLKVIKSLGCIGGSKVFEALDKISNINRDYVRKQLVFAKALISYRLGLEQDPLPFVEGVDRKRGRRDELLKLTLQRVRSKKVGKCVERLEGSTYGIEFADKMGFEVTAGKANWILLLNKKSVEKDLLRSITNQKMIIGLLTRWIKVTGTYSVQYVVLTKPNDNQSISIMVVRTDGEVCYSGRANMKKGIMSFLLSDIERPGTAPTKVKGKFGPRGVKLELTVPFCKRKGQRPGRTLTKAELRQ